MTPEQALAHWSCCGEAAASAKGARLTRVEAPAGTFYLKQMVSPEAARREVALLEHLAAAGLPVALPIPCDAGPAWVEGDAGEGVFVLTPELPGEHYPPCEGEVGLAHAGHLGGALGVLDRVLAATPNAAEFPELTHSADALIKGLLGRLTPFDGRRLGALRSKLVPTAALPRQPIHREPTRKNLLFSDGVATGYLDFGSVQRGPRLFDLCYCASGLLADRFRVPGYGYYWFDAARELARGYRAVVELSAEERSALFSVLVTVELVFMGWLLERGDFARALEAERMLFWLEEHRDRVEAAMTR